MQATLTILLIITMLVDAGMAIYSKSKHAQNRCISPAKKAYRIQLLESVYDKSSFCAMIKSKKGRAR